MRDHVKLFIPGPVEVSADTYAAMNAPMIGHRSKDFQVLYADVHEKLQTLFGTTQQVYLSTSSAWGVMEGAIRNLVNKKVLNCCCGAFSDKWYDVSLRCGKQAEALKVDWGQAITADLVDAKLATGEFDVVTVVHSETSTGVLSPVEEIAKLKAKYPDVLFVVDTVSSFTTLPMHFDSWGLDILLTGSQKAFAMPPGLALFAASEAAYARAAEVKDRGYYFDLLEFQANGKNSMTPSTPCISLIYGLRHQLNKMLAEGLENRYARHARLNGMVHDWVRKNGFEFFAPEGYRTKGLTCVKNKDGFDVAAFVSLLKKRHNLAIDGGYGKIKGQTFRISNMGDESDESIAELIAALDDTMGAL
ncbi:alanine--glyoxylate aminotransferase family protein [Phragmitibacter flavus]|uniref:Alanine--glyoxylate aminotransferase family protein n=1 Tax=Phragmitibacter flavus TaxID=2576071 RepID=A0A5R8KKD6_9BACT|nr:alanine--glyoxylate aminotransferase family protein [Phragmitibacter flavus]TLD72405.1 alanine--glyoxylate aminotransferase family protein [Phragmitibacter flavus]